MIFLARQKYQKIKSLYQEYERLLIPLMLVFGFILDYVTFKNIQVKTALTVFCFYFIIAGLSIAFAQFYKAGRISRRLRFAALFTPLVRQFTFGALLGAVFIFYWFSASVASSWPFIIIVLALIVSNEVLKKYIAKPLVQASVYYFIMFAFFSIVLPYAFNRIGARLFLFSAASSAVLMSGFGYALSLSLRDSRKFRQSLFRSCAVIFVVMNTLYFANIIPPVPLSLRDIGVYHNVERLNGEYILSKEKESAWQKIFPGQTIHREGSDAVYVFTAIFVPSGFKERIVHVWQKYDHKTGWMDRDVLSFNIIGGRTDGYRGYSVKRAVEPGKWRVLARTINGQTLGRITFKIAQGEYELKRVVK